MAQKNAVAGREVYRAMQIGPRWYTLLGEVKS